MTIESLTVGNLATNALVVHDGAVAVIIDPGAEANRFVRILDQNHLTLSAILLTHGHADHISAVGTLREAYPDAVVVCHPEDAPMLRDGRKNLAMFMGEELDVGAPDKTVEDGDSLTFGEMHFKVLHVPGHTPGQIAFLSEGNLFAGDTLFAGGVGRWDLPGGDGKLLFKKLHEKIMSLPDDIVVWPGHGPSTTVGHERKHNPYMDPSFDPDAVGL